MAKQQSCHKFIYKLNSKRLKQAKWNLTLPLSAAMKNSNDIVALNDSQLLRWICELNGKEKLDEEVALLKSEIKKRKKLPSDRENRMKIKDLYQELYSLQYQKDYFCMIMDSDKDYDRANEGFQINGCTYRRLLGTNGGIKKSTITYLSDNLYGEIVKRMENGRNREKPLIPAKLEAYRALICSGSTPVTMPRILIVKDCFVTFREDVLKISDDCGEEPELTFETDCEIEYCDSDGYGFMSPDYSRRIYRDLYGEEEADTTIPGVNTRYAWTKGMLFTFDFVEFARQINHGNYLVKDAWGTLRDVREYDVILTTSMVKLWDSYDSLEHYLACCDENHYQFSVAKTMPQKLEHVRNFNYQFLQTYELSDEELRTLCQPTMEEISDVLGGDYRKTIVFLKGVFLNEENADKGGDDFIKAIMIEPRMLLDPYVLEKVHRMIKKRISMAAKGSIRISGNFAVVSGDLYALAQSVFGLPVTGLLKAGEVYHKYWIDKNVEEIALFRAPMTCHNNIRRRKVVHNTAMDFWYQYQTTGIVLNAHDTTCDALNGADKDSDTFFTTDNEIIIRNTRNSPTIECLQRKAKKVVPTEADIIAANKLAFGDDIGTTTNRITAMIERQAAFPKESKEYQMLDYRIKCGQHYQQTSIDKAKGILANPMPKYWYDKAACQKLPEETAEQKHFKELCLNIVAEKKPYFMKYIYPDLNTEYRNYQKNANSKCIREFKIPLSELREKKGKTKEEQDFLAFYEKFMPVGTNLCTVNRVCLLFEEAFGDFPNRTSKKQDFDTGLLKSGVSYSKSDYKKIAELKKEYDAAVTCYQKLSHKQRFDKEEAAASREMMRLHFKSLCEEICPNEDALCDILIDLCCTPGKSRQFVWDICGNVIIRHLLEKNDYTLHYPLRVDSQGEFEFGGEQFIMQTKKERQC